MPPRQRDTNSHLPNRVYHKHGGYYFVAAPDKDGKQKWLPLGKTEAAMRKALAKLLGETLPNAGTAMERLIERYRDEILPTKASKTQKDYAHGLANLAKSFGHLDNLGAIKPIHIYQYLDARSKQGKTAANREIALLSTLFNFGIRWGFLEANPCRDVKKNREKPRTRYVTDAEYQAVYAIAPAMLQAAMEISAITGMRQGDILNLKRQDLTTEGVLITQRKTGKKQLLEWSPALRSAIDQALALQTINSFYIFANSTGRHYSSSGFQTAWQRLMTKAIKQEAIAERFTFHDLRAKAGSESNDAQNLLGHQSAATTLSIYRRKPEKAKPNR